MSPFWKYKFYGILFSILLAVYLLLPTFLGVRDHLSALKQKGLTPPWYYSLLPQNELNLGLDLRGGLYMELAVSLDEAMDHQVTFLAQDIKRYILKDKLEKGEAIKVSRSAIRVEVDPGQIADFENALGDVFDEQVLLLGESPREIYFAVKSDYESARKSAVMALDHLPDFKGEVLPLKDLKHVGIAFEGSAQKEQILTALGTPELVAQLTPVEIPAGVLHLVLSDVYQDKMRKDIIEQAANAVRNRIDRFGVSEASVSRQGGDRLVIELPGVKNPDEIINIVRRTGKLEFRLVDKALSQSDLEQKIAKVSKELGLSKVYESDALVALNKKLKSELPEGTEILFSLDRDTATKMVRQATPYLLTKQADVTGDMLDNAKVESQNNQPYVSMSFDKTGAKKFGDLTSANVGKQLAIVLDNVVMSAPVIKSAITGGQAQIELGFGRFDVLHKEASDLVLILREGALPASLAVASKNVIGPSLGQDSIDAGVRSILIAAAGVVLFMIFYYRLGGVIANVGLFLNVVFLFAILCAFQASLTLPGMAGIVLTMGMAVDANVIIFERMREEIFLGKGVRDVIETAYSNANRAIIDGNITTFIAGLVLFEFGTGPIKGFATTLMIGIVTTLFTAVVITRIIYDGLVGSGRIKSVGVS